MGKIKQLREDILLGNNSQDKVYPITYAKAVYMDSGKTTQEEIKSIEEGEALGNNSINTRHIKDNAVTTNKVVEGAITSDKLGDNSVETSKIKNKAITNDKIAQDAVTIDKLGTEVRKTLDELAINNRSQDIEISKKANSVDVTSQIQTERNRVNDELAKKFNLVNITQELGTAEDKVISQKAISAKFSNLKSDLQLSIDKKANAEQVSNSLYDLEQKIGDRVVVEGNVTNLPDEEDLTYVEESDRNVLKLADKRYAPENFSGKGYKRLRKNIQNIDLAVSKITVNSAPTKDGTISIIVNGTNTPVKLVKDTHNTIGLVAEAIKDALELKKTDYNIEVVDNIVTLTRKYMGETAVSSSTFDVADTGVTLSVDDSVQSVRRNILTADMISQPNTIYEAMYDFDLNGKILNVPSGFKIIGTSGGSLSNGALYGNDVEIRNITAKNINIRISRTLVADNVNISNEKYFNIGRKGCFILEANNDADVTITNCNISFAENIDTVYGCAVKLIQNGSYKCKLNIKNNFINSWNMALETQGQNSMFNGIIENNIVKSYYGIRTGGNGIAISVVGKSDNLLVANNYSDGDLIALEIAHKCIAIGNILYSEKNYSVSITNTKNTILDQDIAILNNTLMSGFRVFQTNNVVFNGNYINAKTATTTDGADNITYINNVFIKDSPNSIFAVYGKDNIVMNNYFYARRLEKKFGNYMLFMVIDYTGKDASTNNIFKNNYVVIDNIEEVLESKTFHIIYLGEAQGENSKKTTRVLNNVVRGYNDNDYIDNNFIPKVTDSQVLNFAYNKTYSLPMWWNGSKWVDAQNNTPNLKSGATENRPTLKPSDKGFEYYDTTLKKKILWNGTAWVNLDGSSLDIKKSGTTAERPSNVEIGFVYKDTTLNKLVLWEGSKWVNLDGSELS